MTKKTRNISSQGDLPPILSWAEAWADSRSFLTRHWYIPRSFLWTDSIRITSLAKRETLPPILSSMPLWVHWMTETGKPRTRHRKMTSFPTSTVWVSGSMKADSEAVWCIRQLSWQYKEWVTFLTVKFSTSKTQRETNASPVSQTEKLKGKMKLVVFLPSKGLLSSIPTVNRDFRLNWVSSKRVVDMARVGSCIRQRYFFDDKSCSIDNRHSIVVPQIGWRVHHGLGCGFRTGRVFTRRSR